MMSVMAPGSQISRQNTFLQTVHARAAVEAKKVGVYDQPKEKTHTKQSLAGGVTVWL